MEKKMFREAYREAYDAVWPKKDSIEQILAHAAMDGAGDRWSGQHKEKQYGGGMCHRQTCGKLRLVVAMALFLCILSVASLPTLAAHVPLVYRMLEKYVPDLADYIVPERQECADQGIIMRVEGIRLEGNHAQVVVSFGNQEGYRHIKGKVDLYDSYGLVSYEGVGNIGGCSFLTYDETEEKAYFKIDMTAKEDFDREKLSFSVNELLTTVGAEEKEVDFSGISYDMPTKLVELRGSGGMIDVTDWNRFEMEGGRQLCRVLDAAEAEDCAADGFTLTGIAYEDGVLRVQMCMGDNTDADRHVQLFFVDAEGNERYGDGSVSWFEEVGETWYDFYEFGFVLSEAELENARMYGIFHSAQEIVKGDWQVTFRLE